MNDILTKEEVAILLDCEPSTAEEKARTHELPAVKYGKRWLFPKEAMLSHLNAQALAHLNKKAPLQAGTLVSLKKLPPKLPDLGGLVGLELQQPIR